MLKTLRLLLPNWPGFIAGALLALGALICNMMLFTSALQMMAGSAAALVLLRLSGLGRIVARYIERLVTHDATFRALARLRLWLFGRFAQGDLGFTRSGEVLGRMMGDIEALDGLFLRFLLPVTLGSGVILFGLMLLPQKWPLIVLLLIASYALFLLLRLNNKAARLVLPLEGELRAHLSDGLNGLRELLAAGAAHQQAQVIARATSSLVREQLREASCRAAAGLLAQIFHACLIVLLSVSASGSLYLMGYLGAAEVVLALPLALLSYGRLNAAGARLFALAEAPMPCPDPLKSVAVPSDLRLEFSNITFTYPGRPLPLFSGLSLTIEAGERVALIGPSGSGKSSLALMLLKFIAPQQGCITLGGIDLAQMEGEALRQHLGYLSQRTALLAGSLRDNLLLANPQASDDALWQALTQAGLADFVRSLPEGLDVWLGQDGVQFSGGQARRAALAMVLLKDAPLWILDEPLEGLDAATAQGLLKTLEKLSQNRSLLYITHQTDEARQMGTTRTVKLENGQISAN